MSDLTTTYANKPGPREAINANQIEFMFKRYLSNPLRAYAYQQKDMCYVYTSSEYASIGDLTGVFKSDYINLIIDVENEYYDTVDVFGEERIVSKTYNMYIRSDTSPNENRLDHLYDYKLKKAVNDILDSLSTNDKLLVHKEFMAVNGSSGIFNQDYVTVSGVQRINTVSPSNFDDLFSNFDFRETDNYPYRLGADFLGGLRFSWPNYRYQADRTRTISNTFDIKNEFNLITGYSAGGSGIDLYIRHDKDGYIGAYELSNDSNKGNFIEHMDVFLQGYPGINILPDNVKFRVANSTYTFIDQDDVGRELRNEIQVEVKEYLDYPLG